MTGYLTQVHLTHKLELNAIKMQNYCSLFTRKLIMLGRSEILKLKRHKTLSNSLIYGCHIAMHDAKITDYSNNEGKDIYPNLLSGK